MAQRPLVWMGLQKKPPRSHVAFSARESQPRSSRKSPSSSSHSYVSGLSFGMTWLGLGLELGLGLGLELGFVLVLVSVLVLRCWG